MTTGTEVIEWFDQIAQQWVLSTDRAGRRRADLVRVNSRAELAPYRACFDEGYDNGRADVTREAIRKALEEAAKRA